MPKKIQVTWLEYINTVWADVTPAIKEQPLENIEHILSVNHDFCGLFHHSVPIVYLADYSTGRYLSVSKSSKIVLGCSPDEFLKNGISFTADSYQKDDLKLFNHQIFPDRLDLLKTIPPAAHRHYIFSYGYRLKNSKGEYVNLLQRNTFIKSDDKGNPLLSLGMVINIDHFKKENPVIQVVEKIHEASSNIAPEVVLKKAYYLHGEDRLFSKREKEILLWMAEGLTSKQIADKLYISEGTVIIHRKHMLLKTGMSNVAALIAFAIRKEII